MSGINTSSTILARPERLVTSVWAIVTLASCVSVFVRQGLSPTCSVGVLFTRGTSRFSDFNDVAAQAVLATPWSSPFEYPPGAVGLLRLLVDPHPFGWIASPGAAAYHYVAQFTSEAVRLECPPTPMPSGVAMMALASAAALSLVFFSWIARGDRRTRISASIAVFAAMQLPVAALEFTTWVFMAGGVGALLVLALTNRPSVWGFNLVAAFPFACAYPLVFGVDRGNIDVIAFTLIAIGVAVLKVRAVSGLAYVMFGLAAAIKLWPIFLVGLIKGNCWAGRLGLFLLGLVPITLAASLETEGGAPAALKGTVDALFVRAQGNDSAGWLLVFNRTLSSGADYLCALIDWSPPAYVALGLDRVFAILGVASLLLGLISLTLPVPFAIRFGLGVCLVIALAPTSGVYRSAAALIVLAVVMGSLRNPVFQFLYGSTVVLLGLLAVTVSPLYLFELEGLTPLANGVAPSDTLFGSLAFGALMFCLAYMALKVMLRQRRGAAFRPQDAMPSNRTA
jgi:hypothetical protein